MMLLGRVLRHRKTRQLNYPRDLTTIRIEFEKTVAIARRRTALFGDKDWSLLHTALTDEYDNAAQFDKALFEALRGCLKPCEMQCGCENIIILQNRRNARSRDSQYSVGFSRLQPAALDQFLTPNKKNDGVHAESSTSGESEITCSQSYHAVCVFECDAGSWKVKACFGIIEIEMNSSTCEDFLIRNGGVHSVAIKALHGALGQVLSDTIRSVVQYHAKSGKLEASIPVAVIAGRKKNPEDESAESDAKKRKGLGRIRWVSGLVHTPEVCGCAFEYSVESFDSFYDRDSDQDKRFAESAVRLYLDTMLTGLKTARDVCDSLNGGKIPLPRPASGQVVQVGKKKLENLTFCASPISGANVIPSSNGSKVWSIRQGDLFRGKVNVRNILQQPDLSFVDFLQDSENTDEANVLVKVSSKAVHNILVDTGDALSALKDVKQGKSKMVKEIGSVLYAAVKLDIGMMTIMSDLSDQGYKTLTPEADKMHLSALWAGFTDLVMTVLLPIAEKTIIHPDIRPGYDITSNILCKLEDDVCAGKKATMKLIDYESLICVQQWRVPVLDGAKDNRYLARDPKWNATTYLWWQCVFMAYVWSEKVHANHVGEAIVGKGTTLIYDLEECLLYSSLLSPDWPEWLVDLRHFAKGESIDKKTLNMTLTKLSSLFSN